MTMGVYFAQNRRRRVVRRIETSVVRQSGLGVAPRVRFPGPTGEPTRERKPTLEAELHRTARGRAGPWAGCGAGTRGAGRVAGTAHAPQRRAGHGLRDAGAGRRAASYRDGGGRPHWIDQHGRRGAYRDAERTGGAVSLLHGQPHRSEWWGRG